MGTPVADVCRKLAVTETTFYWWKRKFGDLGVTEVRELSLDKTIPRKALKRK